MSIIINKNYFIIFDEILKSSLYSFETFYRYFNFIILYSQITGYRNGCNNIFYIMHSSHIQLHIFEPVIFQDYIKFITTIHHPDIGCIYISTFIL